MNPDIEDILAIIREANLFDDVSSLSRDLSLAEQGVDSLTHFHIFLLLEEHYGIKIADGDIPADVALDDIVAIVRGCTLGRYSKRRPPASRTRV